MKNKRRLIPANPLMDQQLYQTSFKGLQVRQSMTANEAKEEAHESGIG